MHLFSASHAARLSCIIPSTSAASTRDRWSKYGGRGGGGGGRGGGGGGGGGGRRRRFLCCSRGLVGSSHREVSTSEGFPSSLPFPSPATSLAGFHDHTPQMEAKYSKELDVAVRVVQMACSLCQRVQEGLLGRSRDQIKSKDDDSPVTVADWSVQATVSWILSECFGSESVSVIAEEDVQTLSKMDAVGSLESVVSTVNNCLLEAPKYGLTGPKKALGTQEVLEAISRCNSVGGPKGRYWVLDPVDGTLGFVRGDQYAVALALIEDGEVILGVLGCPNYPMKREWLDYHHRYYRITAKLSSPTSGSLHKGCVMYAQSGTGEAWMQPLVHDHGKLEWANSATEIRVSSLDDPALATFCEPVEKANSSHSFTAGLAHSVGLRKQPLCVYRCGDFYEIRKGRLQREDMGPCGGGAHHTRGWWGGHRCWRTAIRFFKRVVPRRS